MNDFFVYDSYWFIGSNARRSPKVFSSRQARMVSVDDDLYMDWVEAGNATRSIASYDELYESLCSRAPAIAHTVAPTWVEAGLLSPSLSLTYLLSAGIELTSTNSPELNGSYRVDEIAQNKITILLNGITRKKATANKKPLGYADVSGQSHNFPEPDFINFARAVQDYVHDLVMTESILLGGGMANWPTREITID